MPNLRELEIFGTRMESLDTLAGLPLVHLRLVWAHKVDTLAPLASLKKLEILVIGDMKKATDLSPLKGCKKLKALHIESGMWADHKVDSLTFMREMPQLREFSMHHLKIADDDLTPICALQSLEWLSLPTKYPVREYARLSVCLPKTQCEEFGSHVTYRVGILSSHKDGGDFVYSTSGVLVGKPSTGFDLPSEKADRLIAKREALIERWREYYRSVDDPAADTRETLVD